jgi:hypothetical protein
VQPVCDDWLTFVRPRLAPALVDETAYERLRGVARRLPGDGLAALEIRLAAGSGSVDLSLKLSEPSRVRGVADALPSPHRQLLRRWEAGELPSVPSFWLEFDLEFAADPSLGGLPDPVVCAEIAGGAEPDWIVEMLLPEMRGAPLESHQRELALRVLAAIPPPARPFYTFDLSPRGSDAIRLEILGLTPEDLPDFLGRVAPDLAPAVAAAAPLFFGAERPHLSLDVTSEGIAPRAGLEASFVRGPHREPRWKNLFDRLIDQGLCDPEKREAVFAWPGQESFWAAPGRWPAETAGLHGICVRTVSHVKLVVRPGQAPEAKVYLLFGWVEGF